MEVQMIQQYLHRKESVILTAIEIIDDLGIQGLSSKEIAKRQGISEGTLFRHFKNKNEIIMNVLDFYSKFDNGIVESIKLKKLRPREALIFFLTSYAEYYENYPAITSIAYAYDIFKADREIHERVKDIFKYRSNSLKHLIEEGQRLGVIKKEVNSENLSDMILGFFRTITLKWRMDEYSFPLKIRILSALDEFLEAFSIK